MERSDGWAVAKMASAKISQKNMIKQCRSITG